MANIAPGGTQSYTVTLDIPAPVGGASVSPTLVPSNAGTVPATVSVPAGQLSASFDYVDGSSASSLMVTATLGQSMASASLTVGAICAGNHVLISEVRSRGAAGASDEFVELYNPTSSPVILDSSWTLSGRSNAASSYSTRWTGTGKTIPAHGHFLIASSGYTQSPATDEALTSGFTDATSVRLLHSGNVVDGLCYAFDSTSAMVFSSDVSYGCEGAPVTTNPHDNGAGTNTDASLERKPGGSSGNCTDTDDNATDFATLTPANPQNTQSSPTP
jgi:hypothetical protein